MPKNTTSQPYVDATWDRPAPEPRIIHLTVTGLDLDRAMALVGSRDYRATQCCLLAQAGKRRFPNKPVSAGYTSIFVGLEEVRFNIDYLGMKLVALFDSRAFDTIKGMLPCQVTLTPRDERLYR